MKTSKLISIIGLSFFGGMLANEYFNSKEFDDLSNNIKCKMRDNATKIKANSENIKDMMNGLQVIGKLNKSNTTAEEKNLTTNKENFGISEMIGLINFMCDMIKKSDEKNIEPTYKEYKQNIINKDSELDYQNKKRNTSNDNNLINKHAEDIYRKKLQEHIDKIDKTKMKENQLYSKYDTD